MSGYSVVIAALQRPGTRAELFDRCRSRQSDAKTLGALKHLVCRGLVVRVGRHKFGNYHATVAEMPPRQPRAHVAQRAQRATPRNRGLLDALPVWPLAPSRTAIVPVSSSWLIGAP